MNVEFVGRQYDIEDRVRDYAEDRLESLRRFADEPISSHIALNAEGHRSVAEIQFSHAHGAVHATEAADDMGDAVHMALDKLEKQLRRSRKKHQRQRRRADHKRAEEAHWPVEVVAGDRLRSGEKQVLRSTAFEIEEMDMEEAATKLESSKNEFVIFRHSATGQTTVLYKRKDGNYGVISPDA